MDERGRADMRWRKSSASNQSNCVEVACDGESVMIRDSKDSGGPALSVPTESWQRFVDFVKRAI